MSNGNGITATMEQPTRELARVPSGEKPVEFVPFGATDKIKLTLNLIRDVIATPTKDGTLPDQRNCMKFLMLCQAGRLNPFVGDCYLLGFKDRDAGEVKWNLITSVSAFWKRAEACDDFDGCESGVIVIDKSGNLVERVGDYTMDGDMLDGGWARVHFKNRKIPTQRRVKLATFKKPFGVWNHDPAGMICKVAECHALRDSFPTMLGGMYIDGEHMPESDGPEVRVDKTDRLNAATGLQAAVKPHPTEPAQVIDASTSNEVIDAEVDARAQEEPPTTQQRTFATFDELAAALEELAQDQGIGPTETAATISQLKLTDCASPRDKVRLPALAQAYADLASGRMGWRK